MEVAFTLADTPNYPRNRMRMLTPHLKSTPRFATLLWIVASFTLLFVSTVKSASVSATLDRPTVPVGESLLLTLSFEGVSPNAPPALPNLPNLQQAGVSQSSQIQIVNGQMTSQKTFQYTLMALQPGDVVIPAMSFQAGAAVLSTQPLPLKIVPASAGQSAGATQDPAAFLRLIITKKEVYVGEPFPVEIHLYWQNGEDIRSPQLQADGFAIHQGREPNHTQTKSQVGNRLYNLLIFRMAASAARAGDLSLGPATCDMTLLIPLRNASRDPFDFFGPRFQRRPASLTSDPFPMRGLPLPTDNVPPSFNGAVGQFTFTVTANPTNVAVGDPITLRARLAGSGHLESLTLPTQVHWRDFKLYPPKASIDPSDPLGLSGQKNFEQVVIPLNHEITALPSLLFSFFDPNLKSYRVLSNAPIPILVGHATQSATPLPDLTNATDRPGPGSDDIIHIKPRMEGVLASYQPLVLSPWFLGLQSVPALTWVGLLIARRRRDALANNPKLQRRRQVDRFESQKLRELRSLAASQNAEAFFALLFRVLQERLGERLDMPASAITEAVIDERLLLKDLKNPTRQILRDLFHSCNQARYAPHASSQELASLIPQLESALHDLHALAP